MLTVLLLCSLCALARAQYNKGTSKGYLQFWWAGLTESLDEIGQRNEKQVWELQDEYQDMLDSAVEKYYSYSSAVGYGRGSPYATKGEGRITAVKVWESHYIRGFQFKYDYSWGPVIGYTYRQAQEITLFEGEAIVQISGKYQYRIQLLVFTTNRGRSLIAGQPYGTSFNFYPAHSESELLLVSGRVQGTLTSLGAHWGIVYNEYNGTVHT